MLYIINYFISKFKIWGIIIPKSKGNFERGKLWVEDQEYSIHNCSISSSNGLLYKLNGFRPRQ